MLSVIRMYPSEQHAREAIRLLTEEELVARDLHLFLPQPGSEAQIVNDAIARDELPGSHVHVCRRALEKGLCVLSVIPPFIRGAEAEQIMENCGAVDTDLLPEYYAHNPTPLSDVLSIPVLTKYKHSFNAKQITRSSWSFSSMFGLKTLSQSKSKNSSFGLPLLTKPKSKKSSFGMPLLTQPKSKQSSFGLPLLSKSRAKGSSFGMPLISNNPAPLSNLFNIPLLSKRNRD